MGARKKLNELTVAGAVGAAAVLGILTGSWTVFVIAGAALIAAGINSGGIRLDSHTRK